VTTEVATFLSLSNATSGDIVVDRTSDFSGPVITAPGNVSITATGDITVGNTITATNKTVAAGFDGRSGQWRRARYRATAVTLDAATGIGNTTALNLAAFFVSADTAAGMSISTTPPARLSRSCR